MWTFRVPYNVKKGDDMTTEKSRMPDESQIRMLIEDRVKAVHAKDVSAAMSHHAPGILMFDVVNPLRYSGADTVQARTKEWFALYDGPIGYEVRDLSITTGDDVAFCHYLYHVSGTRTDRTNISMWVRATLCLRKIDGTWMITHDHESVPFDPESGKASLDLQP